MTDTDSITREQAAALTNPDHAFSTHEITIDSSTGVWLKVSDDHGQDVRAFNSSTVTAFNSSKVVAFGSSPIIACDSVTVTAHGSSTVTSYGSS